MNANLYTVECWHRTIIRPQVSKSSLFSVIIITDCPSYMAVDRQRQSFSGRCCSCLKRTTASFLKTHLFSRSFPDFLQVKWLFNILIAFVTYWLNETNPNHNANNEKHLMPGVAQNDSTIVMTMSYDAANGLIDCTPRLQPIPVLATQTLQPTNTPPTSYMWACVLSK